MLWNKYFKTGIYFWHFSSVIYFWVLYFWNRCILYYTSGIHILYTIFGSFYVVLQQCELLLLFLFLLHLCELFCGVFMNVVLCLCELLLFFMFREGSRKKIRKKCGLLPNQGGGSPRVNKKPNLKFGVLKKGQKWPKMA